MANVYNPADSYELDIQDVEYLRKGETQLARIYQPKGTGPYPTLLYLHGGAWTNNDRTTNPGVPRAVAESGVLVVAIDFRQGASGPYPASSADINYAIRWLKVHAGEYQGRTDAIGCIGSSSGGHLTLLAAMRPRDPRYCAIPLAEAPRLDATLAYGISAMGVLDPFARYTLVKNAGNAELVQRHDDYFGNDETQKEASPVLMLERGEPFERTPVLIVQGTADTASPKPMVESFERMYRAAGGAIEVAMFEGMPHGIWDWTESQRAAGIAAMMRFIAKRVSAVAV
ncbi:MAG TPA: alpha/beta hydrolase [Dehalococcoidia bacterium]|nr:alpha/beta hydrolase [Dehalococcoidia bacterium]